MYPVSAQGIDEPIERMIKVHYYYCVYHALLSHGMSHALLSHLITYLMPCCLIAYLMPYFFRGGLVQKH